METINYVFEAGIFKGRGFGMMGIIFIRGDGELMRACKFNL